MPERSIATVCLSGTLEDKVAAAAAAAFDGIEVFEPDLIASPWTPAELAARCADLGLSIDLYQPFRDLDSTDPDRFARNLRRLERKFDVMEQLGTPTVLVCSSVSPDAVAGAEQLAQQLAAAADRAADRGLRIAFEALAWGRHVSTWEESWQPVALADHPALGLCLDSFHVLSRNGDPAGFADIAPGKIFFLQLADAPHLQMDVLQWSRHHRLFPGQGAFDLPAFLTGVLDAGYDGPLSLEVFNDVFRQADPVRTAVDAMRSLLWLEDQAAAERPDLGLPVRPAAPRLSGYSFVELAVDGVSGPQVGDVLARLGFAHAGQHRSKPVQQWEQGDARVLLNASVVRPAETGVAGVAALGLESEDPAGSAQRAASLLAPVLPRSRGVAEADLRAVAAPDGAQVFFTRTVPDGWPADFLPTGVRGGGVGVTRIDHVGLTQPFDSFDEAALFYREVLGLGPEEVTEIPAPFGLVRDRAVTNSERSVRLSLTASLLRRGEWSPGVPEPQHVAFATDDIVAAARTLREAGAPLLEVPANYHDDLDARFDLDPVRLAAMRELGLFYDETGDGAYLHLYTEVLGGRVFFEIVQRIGGYDGYGAANAPVRMAAHRRARLAMPGRPLIER
ncbi:bifunctional sugar phosphate isomerase/epimerase/4-hydroxyphenylpyruvate dioxygenase family protein [Pseudonocardia sp. DSM 110487]|uniref:bifunctional sugar phosphate isomerase/epimerase/4-hydroxyphenylpyruvate dioxygenase family protein n=1 Tax=Pseudonocardia sp. DSM 110487 TaxID=2865833 RepID=UPI0021032498|nr:sugar phosphate isomerase/epimerase and 4-hydroxyphenylpyruvate domain-containing protein [Pseudonocardia sp. DSM 110487]